MHKQATRVNVRGYLNLKKVQDVSGIFSKTQGYFLHLYPFFIRTKRKRKVEEGWGCCEQGIKYAQQNK